jgi:hypothetical protein
MKQGINNNPNITDAEKQIASQLHRLQERKKERKTERVATVTAL